MKILTLTQGKIATVDDADYERVSKYFWWINRGHNGVFYARTKLRCIDGKWRHFLLHRMLLGYPRYHVDHVNGDGLGNRRENLRLATDSQNLANQKKNRTGTSKFKGVSWRDDCQKWHAQITVSQKKKHLGYFTDEEAAARAHDTAAKKFFEEFAKTNF